TIVSGNVSAAQGVENALYTLELCNNPAPVFIGAKQPFIQKTIHAHWYHGNLRTLHLIKTSELI
ncbi:MAG: hypothetical protein QG673_2234, partial [Pseudomonadota bacterium]|nr:hypothetical protein [Pseudomonadota bacterium]